jgi:hypothetical protein
MAAAKAAVATSPVASGTPSQTTFSVSYTLTSAVPGANNYTLIPGQTAVILKGPGVITSLQFNCTAVISIGYQVVNLSSRGTTQLSSPSIGALSPQVGFAAGLSWLQNDQLVNPAMRPAYVYPIQEVLNANPAIVFLETTAATPSHGVPVFGQAWGTGTIAAGQQFSAQTSFANAYAVTGTFSPSSNVYNVASVSYTYFAPLAFTDECRILLSPSVLWGNQYSYAASPASVSLTVNALVA